MAAPAASIQRSLLCQAANAKSLTTRKRVSLKVRASSCKCQQGRPRAGLVFFNLSEGPESTEKRLALLFFVLLLFELLPFCYMSFYVADRRFFAADVSNDLYHPSAYYLAAVVAGAAAEPIPRELKRRG